MDLGILAQKMKRKLSFLSSFLLRARYKKIAFSTLSLTQTVCQGIPHDRWLSIHCQKHPKNTTLWSWCKHVFLKSASIETYPKTIEVGDKYFMIASPAGTSWSKSWRGWVLDKCMSFFDPSENLGCKHQTSLFWGDMFQIFPVQSPGKINPENVSI